MKTQNQHSESTEALPCVQTPVSRSRFVPMLFSTPMVQAILNGTKTETRRLMNPQPYPVIRNGANVQKTFEWDYSKKISDLPDFEWLNFSPVKVGDIVWVRETFFDATNYQDATLFKDKSTIIYKADETFIGCHKWKPSLFMPKKACRLFLEVVSVSIERLQDIDEESAINEGIENLSADEFKCNLFKNYLRYKEANYQDFTTDNPIWSYQTLWQKINGKDSWDLNPFVWVYKFRSISVPPDFC